MSNPTIVTKLTSLFKGVFGRKDPVVTTVQDKKDETPTAETAETVDSTEAPAAAAETAAEAPSEKTGTPVEKEEEKKEAPAEPEQSETAAAGAEQPEAAPDGTAQSDGSRSGDGAEEAGSTAAEAAKLVEERREGPSAPATADVPEDGSALAEEIEAAEAHTRVASDEVLEKVRKGASPAAEDLAVPTYDELTLPSVRARLRKLTIEQVRDLRSYEVAHQSRPEFVKMYDNRIAKLEAEA
ncbi:hypothetical protein GCM10007079_42120 [Nocardiopsis terrae]|uniref:Chemotaxis protein histidine kinase CheA n=1 Tax=Nocardiopsis terrae TaxID=372655 RepID=A0ABR9HLY2_9ACTN|nr:hypothetical protein [Nocardiopsis terrae]MBE1459973.1 chemotaxis protein histidine kinase CheA [Nocardiopsis terrae]GHC93102.1 hypothetical protein GCM10007079_42120 [Nocardiopsis terrae]